MQGIRLRAAQANVGTADNHTRSPPPPLFRPPPPDQNDHSGKKRNLQLGKPDWAIFSTQTFGSQTPPPSSLLMLACRCRAPSCLTRKKSRESSSQIPPSLTRNSSRHCKAAGDLGRVAIHILRRGTIVSAVHRCQWSHGFDAGLSPAVQCPLWVRSIKLPRAPPSFSIETFEAVALACPVGDSADRSQWHLRCFVIRRCFRGLSAVLTL